MWFSLLCQEFLLDGLSNYTYKVYIFIEKKDGTGAITNAGVAGVGSLVQNNFALLSASCLRNCDHSFIYILLHPCISYIVCSHLL